MGVPAATLEAWTQDRRTQEKQKDDQHARSAISDYYDKKRKGNKPKVAFNNFRVSPYWGKVFENLFSKW